MKNLALIAPWIRMRSYDERLRMEQNDECPRGTTFERDLNADMMDGGFALSAPPWRRALYRFLPAAVALPLEGFLIRRRYRVVISWTDMNALMFALLLKLTGRRKAHVALMFWISKPVKAFVLKRVHGSIDRIVLWTSVHREFATQILGIPASKIVAIPYYVDEQFFRPFPRPGGGDMICSAGREMRDYPTLIRALQTLDIRCHIAAGAMRGTTEPTIRAIGESGPLPHNVTVGLLSARDLRDLYARSRFVVVPLLPTGSDNGLTVILEAMAMGKAVICSRVNGQRDVIREGETGMFVPQGDAGALREAIQFLWDHPEVAERMGAEGRIHVERHHSWDGFVTSVRRVVESVAGDVLRADDRMKSPGGRLSGALIGAGRADVRKIP
jgi:glycosyltransferase involved in cell wall biosynthesis